MRSGSPTARLLELVPKIWMRDRDQRFAALPRGESRELGGAVLGDDDVDLMSRRRDERAGEELGTDARDAGVISSRGRRHAEQRAAVLGAGRTRDEILVAPDARVLFAAARVGDDLAGEIDSSHTTRRTLIMRQREEIHSLAARPRNRAHHVVL